MVGAKDRGVRVRFQFDPAVDLVLADKVQIQQVLLNLIRNAIEAMEGCDKRELASAGPAGNGYGRDQRRRHRTRDRAGHGRSADQNLPGMSGLDLIAKLREQRIQAPAILITSRPSPTVIHRAKQAHVRIIEKPLLNNTLIDGIRAACLQPHPNPEND